MFEAIITAAIIIGGYFFPDIVRRLAQPDTGIYINENGSAVSRRRY